ncbi:MAG: tetratricopeptide repeat protein [Cytophagaceae bacterium]|nr:tetratricopeptide repeat protein [Cytophagaceae bacterium]
MYRILFILLFISLPLASYSQKKKAEQFYESGVMKFESKDYSGAIADLTEAIQLKSGYAEAYLKRGVCKSWLGDNKSALEDLNEAVKLKHSAEAYFERAYVKYLLYEYEGAITDFNKVIELKPDYKDAYFNRGLAKYEFQDYIGALSDNTKVIELDPNYTYAYYNRGLARYAMKDYKGALSDNRQVLKLDPSYQKAHYQIGLCHYNLGEYEESIKAYDISIELNPKYENALYNRGLAKHYNKDYAGAISDFSKLLDMNPKDYEAYYRRGLAKYLLNDFKGSVADYEKCLQINPEFEKAKTELSFASAEAKRSLETTNTTKEAENINIDIKMPQIWAVVVGVSNYKDPNMNLKFADKDATDFYNFLKSPEGGALSDDHVVLLTNEKATRSNIIKALNEKFYRAFEDDMVILFFASHGQPDPVGNEVYFLSHDAESDNLGGTAVSQIDIEKVFTRTKAKKKIWIADACHSGGAGLQVRASHSALTNKLLTEIANSNNGMAMFTASSSSEYSYEDSKWGGGHGVFTHYLLKGMKGEADKDNNGLIEIRELYEYVYRQVSNDTNGQQHPELKGSFDNKLPIAVTR